MTDRKRQAHRIVVQMVLKVDPQPIAAVSAVEDHERTA